MKTSQAGISLIESFEGYRDKAYQCPAGIWTIGYGTTKYPSGVKVKQGDICTKEQAHEWKAYDVLRYEANVMKFHPIYKHNQNEFDALVSFAYNIGSIDQLTSKSGITGARTKTEIAGAIPNYNKARDKNNNIVILNGLVRRREAERALYILPVNSPNLINKNPYPMPNATIRKGSPKNDVMWLQWELTRNGYQLIIDGIWGTKTQAAVLLFQKARHLVVDALVGPKTKQALVG